MAIGNRTAAEEEDLFVIYVFESFGFILSITTIIINIICYKQKADNNKIYLASKLMCFLTISLIFSYFDIIIIEYFEFSGNEQMLIIGKLVQTLFVLTIEMAYFFFFNNEFVPIFGIKIGTLASFGLCQIHTFSHDKHLSLLYFSDIGITCFSTIILIFVCYCFNRLKKEVFYARSKSLKKNKFLQDALDNMGTGLIIYKSKKQNDNNSQNLLISKLTYCNLFAEKLSLFKENKDVQNHIVTEQNFIHVDSHKKQINLLNIFHYFDSINNGISYEKFAMKKDSGLAEILEFLESEENLNIFSTFNYLGRLKYFNNEEEIKEEYYESIFLSIKQNNLVSFIL